MSILVLKFEFSPALREENLVFLEKLSEGLRTIDYLTEALLVFVGPVKLSALWRYLSMIIESLLKSLFM